MLKGSLLHPEILKDIGQAGRSRRVLISDGNFPHSTWRGPNSSLVFLNLAPGLLTVTQVLEALVKVIPIEDALSMKPNRTGPYAMKSAPPIFQEFRHIGSATDRGVKLRSLERFTFYDQARSPDVCLTIATGKQRIYANQLLTIGVVK